MVDDKYSLYGNATIDATADRAATVGVTPSFFVTNLLELPRNKLIPYLRAIGIRMAAHSKP